MARTTEVERSKLPSASSCTTSAFSPSTKHTARRRPTVVNGSYVTLSSSTRRTPASRLVRSAKNSLTGRAHRVRSMYPTARRLDLTENIHGSLVDDPYRWLEDPASAESLAWLEAQDALLREHAAVLPGRPALAVRVRQLMSAGYVSAPVWRGQRQFFLRRGADQEHPVLMTAAPGEPERTLIDPMALDPSGATTLDYWEPDHEGRLLAYHLSEHGDEEWALRVVDVLSGEFVEGPIDRSRYSPIAWLPGGKAFYYVRKLPATAVPPGEEQYHRRVYLHTVGLPPEEDVLIFGEGREKTNY